MSPDTGSSSVVQGVVSATLPNARFLCRAADGSEVTCHVAGEMRMKVVRLLVPILAEHPQKPIIAILVAGRIPAFDHSVTIDASRLQPMVSL